MKIDDSVRVMKESYRRFVSARSQLSVCELLAESGTFFFLHSPTRLAAPGGCLFLASDALEGRAPRARGLDTRSAVIWKPDALVGIAPPLRNVVLPNLQIGEYTPANSDIKCSDHPEAIPAQDYVFLNIGRDPAQGAIDLELVFVGQGLLPKSAGPRPERLDVVAKGCGTKRRILAARASQVFGGSRAREVMAATIRGGAVTCL